jgi:phytoene synthase
MSDASTFAPGMRLLPAKAAGDVRSLYRVLRTLDDLVDEDDPAAAQRVGAVERWAHTTGEQADPATGGEAAGVPETAETRALAALAGRHPLPGSSLLEFCAGMRHDIARKVVRDERDFERYCQRAGGSVGVILARMLGDHEDAPALREAERRMATLGRAMQVTNILRDIDEDHEHGRVYISRSAIERFGFPAPGRREQLLRDHIERADALYDDGLAAIPLLGEGSQAMALSADLYREILREIEREGFGRRRGRVVVPAWRRRALALRYQVARR